MRGTVPARGVATREPPGPVCVGVVGRGGVPVETPPSLGCSSSPPPRRVTAAATATASAAPLLPRVWLGVATRGVREEAAAGVGAPPGLPPRCGVLGRLAPEASGAPVPWVFPPGDAARVRVGVPRPLSGLRDREGLGPPGVEVGDVADAAAAAAATAAAACCRSCAT